MIPIRDTIPRVHPPVAVLAIMGVNVLAFGYELLLSDLGRAELFHLFGLVPYRYVNPDWAAWAGYTGTLIIPPVTYMFLHDGVLHLILNMWMLWIFADNIEDVMGPWRFTAFYLICGLAAVAVHVVFNLDARAPIIGASGAVAGVLGAYFVLYPHGRVLTLIPVFIVPLFFEIPAVVFLGVWFAIQVISALTAQAGGAAFIAWWAHAGGFAAGMLLVRPFKRKDRCYYCWNPSSRSYDREE